VHAGCVEPIFEAVLANDPSRITPAAAAQRMDEDLLLAELHWLYRGDTPLHLAAAGFRYDAARALLAACTPVNAVSRRGATALHYSCDPEPGPARGTSRRAALVHPPGPGPGGLAIRRRVRPKG
jgi:ankyrin repeat protein